MYRLYRNARACMLRCTSRRRFVISASPSEGAGIQGREFQGLKPSLWACCFLLDLKVRPLRFHFGRPTLVLPAMCMTCSLGGRSFSSDIYRGPSGQRASALEASLGDFVLRGLAQDLVFSGACERCMRQLKNKKEYLFSKTNRRSC